MPLHRSGLDPRVKPEDDDWIDEEELRGGADACQKRFRRPAFVA
jgi:hypothetical protein